MLDNEYNQDTKPTEVSYYPAHTDTVGRKGGAFLKTLAAIACTVAISAASISGYIVYSDYADGDLPADNPQESNTAVSQTSGKDGEAKAASLPDLITLSSREKALTVPEIVSKVTPSVVGISCITPMGTATGSGIVMTTDGYIITNAHVVNAATEISVLLSDGTKYAAEIIGADSRTDLAVVKISPAAELVHADFGNSDDLVVGELAIAIGNPLGFDFYGSATSGIISGLERSVTINDKTLTLIQTDAAINSGNSGGPLVNSYGQVIGINSAKVSTVVAEGMGFSIPINDAVPIINDLISNGYVTGRPLIGITGFDITEDISDYYNLPVGVYVAQLYEGSPAAQAGVTVGDVIVGINGSEVSSMEELNTVKNGFSPGEAVTLSIVRGGSTVSVKVILGEETK